MKEKSRTGNRNIPSFSASVLDAIYRSADDAVDSSYRFTSDLEMSIKHRSLISDEDSRRALVIENLKQRKIAQKVAIKGIQPKKNSRRHCSPLEFPFIHSSSSSSESSCGAGFSSSEADSISDKKKPLPVVYPTGRKEEKPFKSRRNDCFQRSSKQIPHIEEQNVKAKSKALEKYTDLKKNSKKQPSSPGAKVAGFLNSLLITAGNTLKSKATYKSSQTTPCSTPSSFSRSCLSKTSSSMGNQNAAVEKRTVKFVDEVGKTQIGKVDRIGMESKRRMEEEGAKNQQQRLMKIKHMVDLVLKEEEEESEDDGLSCCSSDLFELDSLSVVGVGDRYGEELPVYGTTNLSLTSRTIAGT